MDNCPAHDSRQYNAHGRTTRCGYDLGGGGMGVGDGVGAGSGNACNATVISPFQCTCPPLERWRIGTQVCSGLRAQSVRCVTASFFYEDEVDGRAVTRAFIRENGLRTRYTFSLTAGARLGPALNKTFGVS